MSKPKHVLEALGAIHANEETPSPCPFCGTKMGILTHGKKFVSHWKVKRLVIGYD